PASPTAAILLRLDASLSRRKSPAGYSLVSCRRKGRPCRTTSRFVSVVVCPKKPGVGRGDPRNLFQPCLPGSVVGECSMEWMVTSVKLRRYMLGNCTFVTNLSEGNQGKNGWFGSGRA